ncbi:hypothetical protein LPJGGPFB_03159 [Ensifer adhaerens]|uniref:hypothetical protein n=1 Tax=Ensifer adhaerens TaxID=106592 RepID=UPI00156A4E93|nr:hypothetical protein [Ensifer adhaerens]NRP19901.1 hypothetical protein [Ensifer adhaerens]
MNRPVTIYHISGETAEMTYSIDARSAVERHPNEWSFEPFSEEQVRAHKVANKAMSASA